MWHLLCNSGDYQTCPLVLSIGAQVRDKVLSLFLTINVGCLLSWGAEMWGVLHSNLILYEADDVHEAMMIHYRRLISISLSHQPRKQVRFVHVWKTLPTVTLWALWKCRYNRLYDAANLGLSDVLLEIW